MSTFLTDPELPSASIQPHDSLWLFLLYERIKRIQFSGFNVLLPGCVYTANIYGNSDSTPLPPCEQTQFFFSDSLAKGLPLLRPPG